MQWFTYTTPATAPTSAERVEVRAGDEIVPEPDVVFDRSSYLPATPGEVWPWLVQLGKDRAGWYLPLELEQTYLNRWAGLRDIDDELRDLAVGDTVMIWGRGDPTVQVAQLLPGRSLVYRAQHRVASYALTLTLFGEGTRLHCRIRLGSVRFPGLVRLVGGVVVDRAFALLASGLQERLMCPDS
jgi:hypothetical protein